MQCVFNVALLGFRGFSVAVQPTGEHPEERIEREHVQRHQPHDGEDRNDVASDLAVVWPHHFPQFVSDLAQVLDGLHVQYGARRWTARIPRMAVQGPKALRLGRFVPCRSDATGS